MIKSAEGSAGLLHKITKPTPWRTGDLGRRRKKEVLLDRCEVTRREWSTHWQCDEDVQNMQDIHWRNEELRRCEEALPRLLEGDLERASRMYKSKTGVGWDGSKRFAMELDVSPGVMRAPGWHLCLS